MGPVREPNELQSNHRFRFARYCLFWLGGLGLPFILLLIWAPSVSTSQFPLMTMFFYIGLPIGCGVALVAALSFLIGALWSSTAEKSLEHARRLERYKLSMLATLMLPVFAFATYLSFDGLLNLEVHAFSKNFKHIIFWNTQPGWYVVNVLLWGVSGFTGFVQVIRKLRSVYAV